MNKIINILIVEDESFIAEELRRIVIRLGYNVSGVAHRYDDAVVLLKLQPVDIVLLDICLNFSESDGIDLADHINSIYKIPFIYITANADVKTVSRAKLTEPAAYIPKPFNPELIYTNIEIAVYKHLSDSSSQYIIVKQGSKKVFVDLKTVVYLKANNLYTEIHTANGKKYMVREYLKNLLGGLSATFLVQTHRSYAVNLNYIQSVNTEFAFWNDQKFPISESYKKNVVLLNMG
ncbi:MAG: response regulator [Chitinophagaceae bacterium]